MESKIKDNIKNFLNREGVKVKIIFAAGLIGIALIFASDIISKNTQTDTQQIGENVDYTQYVNNLESRLENIISSIDGVGECEIMITLENSSESVYATDNEKKSDSESTDTKDQYVIYDSQDGEKPVLIKENFPIVQGVSVVCGGGDNIEIKERIINTVTSLFNISTNRVSVSKIKS